MTNRIIIDPRDGWIICDQICKRAAPISLYHIRLAAGKCVGNRNKMAGKISRPSLIYYIYLVGFSSYTQRAFMCSLEIRMTWRGKEIHFPCRPIKSSDTMLEHQQSSALSNWNAIKIMDCHHSFFCIRAAAAISTCRSRCNVTPTCFSMVLCGVRIGNMRWIWNVRCTIRIE